MGHALHETQEDGPAGVKAWWLIVGGGSLIYLGSEINLDEKMSLRDILGITIPEEKVVLSWINEYSGTVIRTPASTLIFDPIRVRLRDVPQADVIVVTHEHHDHFEAKLTKDLQKKTGATVVTTPFVASQLRGIPSEKLKALRAKESLILGEVRLDAEPSDHPGFQPLTFMVTTDSDIGIYHSSDSRPFPEMRRIGERAPIDIALCTVGIAPDTSPRSGAEIAKLIRPKVAIPYHVPLEGPLREFATILGREAPEIRVKVLKQFEVYHYPE